MTATLVHRGPDAEGVYIDKRVGLGHRRLSIMDLSPLGAQPMQLHKAGAVVVYNGEIYNFESLRRELISLGISFRGRSDTEVLIKTYEQWGLDGLKRLEGIFAFALWDPNYQRLVLVRDRLGVKPLFYTEAGQQLVFGSEIKAIIASGMVDRSIDQQAFSEYLWYGNAYEERTIYQSVRALLPGHWLIIENGNTRIAPWWKIEEWLEHPVDVQDFREAAEALQNAIDSAVKRQLIADVPVGIFLSGGLDSSSIAAAAMSVQSKSLQSFSVGFDYDRGINELPKAGLVAKHLGLEHHEFHIKGENLCDTLITLAETHDEPFADAANIPLNLMSKELGGTLKVVLQGDGGDEMFAGYRRYLILHHLAFRRFWPDIFTPLLPKVFGQLGKRLARVMDATGMEDSAMRMALLLTTDTLREPPTDFLISEAYTELESTTDPFLAYRRSARRFMNNDPAQRMLLTDISLQLPSTYLTKVDRATMAYGLEARVPLLDERVAELVVGMPSRWKLRGMHTKKILRYAMRDRLPPEILDGPKIGFGVPYGNWLRTSLHDFARDAVIDNKFLSIFGLSKKALETAFDKHRYGQRDYGLVLWKYFQLALWNQTSR